jgi:hypothetical protein
MKKEQKRQKMTLQDYFQEYDTNKLEVRKRTSEKYQNETQMLYGFIDNWFKLIPRDTWFSDAADSLPGIMLLNSWKLANTIACEILSGEYFEAIRNLRFTFEGIVQAVLIENAVESLPYEDRENIAPLPAKVHMLKLWEECKRKKNSTENLETSKIEEIVLQYLNNHTELHKVDEAARMTNTFTKLLSDKRLYVSTTKMVELCAETLRLDSFDIQTLKKLWRDLSTYQHFSHPYLETIITRPDLCFWEKLDDDLFKQSFDFYFSVIDFFYAILAWRFEDLRSRIKEICENSKNGSSKEFRLTSKILNNLEY